MMSKLPYEDVACKVKHGHTIYDYFITLVHVQVHEKKFAQ